jgi:hypothetical protein
MALYVSPRQARSDRSTESVDGEDDFRREYLDETRPRPFIIDLISSDTKDREGSSLGGVPRHVPQPFTLLTSPPAQSIEPSHNEPNETTDLPPSRATVRSDIEDEGIVCEDDGTETIGIGDISSFFQNENQRTWYTLDPDGMMVHKCT